MTGYLLSRTTQGPEETRHLGQNIGTYMAAPMLLALTGDLGSGKTVFVQGLAAGLHVPATYYITSPSFTLINEYPGRLRLFHVDLFRLENADDLHDIGLGDILEGQGVVAIEWAEKLGSYWFSNYVAIHFDIIDDETRAIHLRAYGHAAINLLKAFETQQR